MSENKKPIAVARAVPNFSLDEVGGIAVDTNVYRAHGFRVRMPPLSSIAEVRELGLTILVPEVWKRETLKHLRSWAESRLSEVRQVEKLEGFGTAEQGRALADFRSSWAIETPETIAGRLYQEHEVALRAKVLTTAWNAGGQVLDRYFDAHPPFDSTGSKKHEFPDALALVTLEVWAKAAQRKVVVVTADEGCLAACDSCEHLVGVRDLVDALAMLRSADAARKQEAAEYERVLESQLKSEVSPLRLAIEHALGPRVEALDVEVRSWSDVRDYEHQVDEVSFERVVKGLEVRVISVAANSITFAWTIEVEVSVQALFYRESGGRRIPHVPYSVPRIKLAVYPELEAIVTLQSAKRMSPEQLSDAAVHRLDLGERWFTADFGEVEPSRAVDDDES